MAAVLTNQGGYYTPMEYAEEARRLGVTLLPPCINRGRKEFWGQGREIRVGWMQVKGLADGSVESILEARRTGGPFADLADFVQRTRITHSEAASLARCGALDVFGQSRPALLWEIELRAAANRDAGETGGMAVIGSGGERVAALVAKIPPLPQYDAPHRMRAEIEVLELTLEAHPFQLFQAMLERVRRLRPIVRSDRLRDHAGQEVYLLGWKVTAKRTSTTDGEPMCFVTFSDPHGRFEASFFPEVYARTALELVRGMGPYLVKGKVEIAFGVAEVVASHIKLLGAATAAPDAAH